MHDVIVIGGGPSGLNTAIRLAKKGLRVIVLEKKDHIGKHIVCTGIVGKDAFQKYDLAERSVLTEIKKVKMISPFQSALTYNHAKPLAYVVDREKFDKHLANMAQSNGAEIKLGHLVTDISINDNYVEVLSERKGNHIQKHQAKVAVIATGIDYRLNKKIGLGFPRNFINGVQAELDLGNIDQTTIFVGKNIAPGAFAWAVPISEKRARIGLLAEKDPKLYFKNFIEKFYPEKAKKIREEQIQYKVIAQGLTTKTYTHRAVVVGEAAGQIKTTTGGGIFFGLLCSSIASDVILKGFNEDSYSSRFLSEYERLWRKKLQKEIQLGFYARKMYEKLSDSQIEKIFEIAQSDGIIPLIKEKGDFNWHSELIFSLIKKSPFLKIFRQVNPAIH